MQNQLYSNKQSIFVCDSDAVWETVAAKKFGNPCTERHKLENELRL